MSNLFNFLNDIFSERTNLPIQVGDNLETYVEERRAPRQSLNGSRVDVPDFLSDSIAGED